MLPYISAGLSLLFTLENLVSIVVGVLAGIVIGAIPGLTANMGIIIFLPITYSMPPVPAMLLLLGLYCGGTYGGSITAILINSPGDPANAATTIDGYPLTKQGKPLKALTMALYASFLGGILSAIVLLFGAPAVASVTKTFGPPEYFCITVFGLSIIASVSDKNLVKGLLGGILGMFITMIGQDSISGSLRFTFGIRNLNSGIPLLVNLIGLFAIAELLSNTDYDPGKSEGRAKELKLGHGGVTWPEFRRCIKTMLVSTAIGVIVGATPGTGGGIAGFISYDRAKKRSAYSDNFGKGEIEGVAAVEAANNATTGATLIPMMTMGIPGDGCTAVLMGAFMLQGMVPGPTLFRNFPEILYGIMLGLLVVNVAMLVFGRIFTRYYVHITRIPYELMSALIIIYCIAGIYSSEGRVFHVLLAVIVGIFAYLLRKLHFSVLPIILGIVLGSLAEQNYRRSMIISDGSFSIFVSRPFCIAFLALAALSILTPAFKSLRARWKDRRVDAKQP